MLPVHMPAIPMKKSPELQAVTKRLLEIFVSGSTDSLPNLVSAHPDARAIFTADRNWVAGSDGLIPLMAERSKRMDVDRIEFDRLEAFEVGDFGWAACAFSVLFGSGGSSSFRNTTTFVMEDGVWKAVQMHTSVGVPDEETFGYELAGALKDIVESLTSSSAGAIAQVADASGTVTLMFTDIEDSTRLGQEKGDAAWTEVIRRHFESVTAVVVGNGGKVIKTLGDGTMTAFPTARNAVDAAIAIERSTEDDEIRLRIGIHTGEAISVGGDYAGLAVAKAARIASAAAGGEILVSSATRELLDRFDYTFDTERAAELKGLDGTHRLYPVVWNEAAGA